MAEAHLPLRKLRICGLVTAKVCSFKLIPRAQVHKQCLIWCCTSMNATYRYQGMLTSSVSDLKECQDTLGSQEPCVNLKCVRKKTMLWAIQTGAPEYQLPILGLFFEDTHKQDQAIL